MDDRAYAYLRSQLISLLDIDISAYKSRQMRRRLDAFVAARTDGPAMAFLRRLRHDTEALAELRDMLTINVSEFFRDAPQFDALARDVLPSLTRGKLLVSIWSAGCSRGHEPYSLAILLDELGLGQRASILASDFDREALRVARNGGPYPPNELRNVSRRRLDRYFGGDEDRRVVSAHLTRRVRFQELNLLKDRFDAGFDLVVCRNVMIYFSAEVKSILVRRFLDSLKPGGVLFIGATEALLGDEAEGFERLGGNFYRKVAAGTRREGRAA